MKIISWNVRGLGEWGKRKDIKDFLLNCSPNIVLLQETKLKEVGAFDIRSIWGVRCKDWIFLPSCGASGGVLIMWDTKFASKVEAIYGSFSVSVLLEVKGRGRWWFSSIYGPPSQEGERPSLRSWEAYVGIALLIEFWEGTSMFHGLCMRKGEETE